MKPNLKLVLAASVCVANAAVAIQNDPVSGVWTGWIGRSEASPASAVFDIKLTPEGKLKGKVTGARITPGEITTGWYDEKTGALTFKVWIKASDGSDKGGEVTFNGIVKHDSANGSMKLGEETGMFRMTREPTGMAAERVVKEMERLKADPALAAAKRGFVEVSGWITRAAEMVPAEKYSYRPVGTVRTFGEIVAHVADGARYYCTNGSGKKVEWSDASEKTAKGKDAITSALKKAFADCGTAYESGKDIGPLIENVGHSNLHYGNIVTYLRMMGMVPPSS